MLTGGGDAPGLNAAICGLGRRLWRAGHRLVGFPEGWRGLIEGEATDLGPEQFHDLLTRGGSILGSGSASPYRESKRDVPRILAVFRRLGLDALVAIGGDGTLKSACRLHREEGLPVVGVPKTIDNDVAGTDFAFGFFSAVERATRAMDDLRTTAESHSRVIVVECMGRNSGWITAYAGVAAAAEAILVPERPVDLDELCERLGALHRSGRRAAIVAAAEGARLYLGKRCISSLERDEFGQYLTGGVAEVVARHVQERLGWEARPMVLGHLQRCGKPIAFDRIFALRLGARAAGLVLAGRFGRMAALRNGELSDIPLEEAIAEPSTLSEHFLDRYENFFLPISHR